jgi:flagellar hook-length control protein FliK
VIGGISSQVGFTEESSDLYALRPKDDRGFDQVLKRAARERSEPFEPKETASPPKPSAGRRALFEEPEPEPRRGEPGDAAPPREAPGRAEVAGEAGKKVPHEQADPSAAPSAVQERAPTVPPSEEEQTSAIPDGTVLQPAQVNPEVLALQARAEHLSGIGQAAYQLSPHGKGEGEAAAQTGGLTLQPPPSRAQSAQMEVAAQAVPADELLEAVPQDEPIEPSTRRKQLPGIVKAAEADVQAELDAAQADPQERPDSSRLALLNSMRQPPAGAHPAYASAFGKESTAGLKEAKSSSDAVEGARTSVLQHAKGADPSQAAGAVPHPSAAQRGTIGAVQKPDRDQPPLMERVAQEIRWSIRNDRSEATIRLEPDHLGTMRIKVVHSGDTLRIDMTVDNQQARALVESRLSDLQQRLGQQDLGAEQFAFNVNVQDGGGWDSFKQAAQSARAVPYAFITKPDHPAEAAMPAGISRPIWGRAGVGIYA